MKNVIIIAITILMFAKPFWPIVDYLVNYDYIVTVLCENKDKPEMHCNGKCHLGKELAKENADDTKNPFHNKTFKSEIPQVIISENISEYLFTSEIDDSNTQQVNYAPILHNFLFSSKILHPPRLA